MGQSVTPDLGPQLTQCFDWVKFDFLKDASSFKIREIIIIIFRIFF